MTPTEQAIAALEKIRGPVVELDENGLIEDSTCYYCDQNSTDGCDEDCPRELASAAIAALKAKE